MLLNIKTFSLQNNYTRYEKKYPHKIVHLEKIYTFTPQHLFIRNIVFCFASNLCEIRKKMYGKKIIHFIKIYKLVSDYFSIRVIYFYLQSLNFIQVLWF